MTLNLNENIRTYRKRLFMTQEQLAERLGVSFQSVSRWENSTTVPDIELIVEMARLFGCTVDALLGCGEEHRRPTDEELRDALKTAMDEQDIPAVNSVLRTVRCEYGDEAFMAIWFLIAGIQKGHPLYGNEEILKELRLLFHEMLNGEKFHIARCVVIHTWLALENDREAEKIIIKYSGDREWDMSEIGLRVARADGLRDFENSRKLRDVRSFIRLNEFLYDPTTMRTCSDNPGDPVLLKGINERKLRMLHDFCAMTPDPMHPVSGDGEPDIFVGSRLEIGFCYAAQLAGTGEHQLALTVLEDCGTLIEKITAIPGDLLQMFREGRGDYRLCPTVSSRVPELAHLTCYIRPERWFTAQGFPHGMELLVCGEDGKILHCQPVRTDLEFFLSCYKNYIRDGMDDRWLDPIRSHPRYTALIRRLKTSLPWYGNVSAPNHSDVNHTTEE